MLLIGFLALAYLLPVIIPAAVKSGTALTVAAEVTTVATTAASVSYSLPSRDARVIAWEFTRLSYIFQTMYEEVKAKRWTVEPYGKEESDSAYALMKDYLSDAPRFVPMAKYLSEVNLGLSAKDANLSELVAYGSDFCQRYPCDSRYLLADERLALSQLNVASKLLIYASVIFTHERLAHDLLSIHDYESDVRPSFYDDENFGIIYQKAKDKVYGSGLPSLDIPWRLMDLNNQRNHLLFRWEQFIDEMIVASGKADDPRIAEWKRNLLKDKP